MKTIEPIYHGKTSKQLAKYREKIRKQAEADMKLFIKTHKVERTNP